MNTAELQAEEAATNGEPVEKTYPCPGTISDDHFFENEQDEFMGVETRTYNNGSKTKTVKLSDGRIALCRRVKTREMIEAEKVVGNNKDNVYPAIIAVSTTIDNMPIVMEDVMDMWANDYGTLKHVSNSLNF